MRLLRTEGQAADTLVLPAFLLAIDYYRPLGADLRRVGHALAVRTEDQGIPAEVGEVGAGVVVNC